MRRRHHVPKVSFSKHFISRCNQTSELTSLFSLTDPFWFEIVHCTKLISSSGVAEVFALQNLRSKLRFNLFKVVQSNLFCNSNRLHQETIALHWRDKKNERINIFALKINDTLMNISNMKWLKDGSMVVGREGYYLLAKSLTSPALLRINCPRWIMIQLQIRMIQLQIWMIQLQIRMTQLHIWLIHLQERMALQLDLFYFWQREAPWNQIYSCLQLLKTDNHIAETFSSFPLLLPFFNCPSNFLAMPWCILQDWIWYLTGSYFSKKICNTLSLLNIVFILVEKMFKIYYAPLSRCFK